MSLTPVVLDHPLAATWLTELREASTPPIVFRGLVRQLAAALAWEAARGLATEAVQVLTTLTATTGCRLAGTPPLIVPILRAGAWMLEPTLTLVPYSEVGIVGMARDETSLEPTVYIDRLPATIEASRTVLVLDPMLATGGSLCAVGRLLAARGVGSATVLSVLAAPEGIARLAAEFPSWQLYTASIDDRLDHRGFIVPGLGDAGDRLCAS
ncbi:MAG: uracil phosphoribosyltransferase [Acidimicrobiales bacterium]